jgi:uncharacterized PurR-regulated membrane protein YhhQ (DUF165 family)
MVRPDHRILAAVAAMAVVVAASNVLVQHPFAPFGLADYLTWGAFTYPFAFLVTDLSNRAFGPATTRRIVLAGFAVAVVASIVLATPRIALASGTAFLSAQLLDVAVFDRLRHATRWWTAPFVSSLIASALDTALFFSLAFAGEPLPWVSWALCDFAVKVALAALALVPYRLISTAAPLAARA